MGPTRQDRTGDDWVSRRATTNGWSVWPGNRSAREPITPALAAMPTSMVELLRFFIGGDDLVKTAARTNPREIRNNRAFPTREQA
jgi:hypothetical protein